MKQGTTGRHSPSFFVAAARFRGEADIIRQAKPAELVENDPKRTSCRPVVLMHNHPGGGPIPSRADIAMTRVIVEIAKQFGIAIQDHIIVGKQGHASLKELKLI
jgi:DNA repair protein RadC